MITQITINNIASYKSATQLITDKKVNIIYGLNGSGKSTFSNYFYNHENIEYKDCSHIGDFDSILVYNQKFIQDNFYAKDTLKGIFSLSKENKAAQQRVEQITTELQKHSEDLKALNAHITQQQYIVNNSKEQAHSKVWEIKKNYSGGDRVLDLYLRGKMGGKESLFNHLCSIPLPLSKPSKTIEEIKASTNAIKGDTAIKYDLFNKLTFINLTNEDLQSLNEIIVGSNDSPVSKLIVKLQNSDWISEGLKYLEMTDNSQCPFCQSKTITEQLISGINDYFDESYKSSLLNIQSILTRYNTNISNIPSLDIYKTNPFTNDFLIDLNDTIIKISNSLEKNIELIKQKISNPSLQITLLNVSESIDSFNQIIENLNIKISKHNTIIDNVDSELAKIKSEFWSILRFEYDQTISNFNSAKISAESTIKSKEDEISRIQGIIDKKNKDRVHHQKSTVNIEDAIFNINQGLIDIGITDFHIEKYDQDLYHIVRTNAKDKIFSSLSEGEKMIISFLYFRELLRGKSTSTEGHLKKIAIIDDPVSSLSHIFVYNIGRLLINDFFNSNHIEQVFVLTHSLYFFYELTDTNKDRRKLNQNLFRLSKNSEGSSIKAMNYEEVQNDYQSYWSVINDDKQPPALIANCMRNIIEYFFNFVHKADFSNITQKPEFQNPKYQALFRYINRESHSLGQNIFDFKEFNYDDFKSGLKLIFEESGYINHYNKMAKIQ